ncbi:hypothetical protein BESB_044580 [Besnoitia besnoiti]|uniref:Transmembrane protein n=1 Tax=Besnoitia besnoiti TaxID=94643 RepID=A0A2A9MJX3_BESBE|nr:hypothetical protein BESB_044580 [Besnoitia besnoiti]PFH36266.1 hypothetical protein BESB_044580 [Besnoitia besnoiti]
MVDGGLLLGLVVGLAFGLVVVVLLLFTCIGRMCLGMCFCCICLPCRFIWKRDEACVCEPVDPVGCCCGRQDSVAESSVDSEPALEEILQS